MSCHSSVIGVWVSTAYHTDWAWWLASGDHLGTVCLSHSAGCLRGGVARVPVLTCGGCKAPSNSCDHGHGRHLEWRKCSGDGVVEALLG